LANTCAEKRNLKTALAAQHGHLSFRVMPFGRGNAPTTLQRVMDHVLYGRNWTHCLVYLDDVVVFAPTEEEHLQILDLVLGKIAKAGLTLKPAEYHRMKKSVNSLGFIVWSERASVDRAKVKPLGSFPLYPILTRCYTNKHIALHRVVSYLACSATNTYNPGQN